MSSVILGVGAGIAAYKSCELLRRLTESGHRVRVVPTADALRFVGAPTWAALSGQPVSTEVWDAVDEVPHVRLGQDADLVLVAPATADLLAKAAHGLAGDLLTNVLLTARCPVVYAPAMHTEMWEHPATQANVATLRARGAIVVEPATGRLTGADSGAGRLPEAAELAEVARRVLARGTVDADLAGRHVVISAGGTREDLDPVRFLGNRSSGRQGYALARTAVARGARVTLVAANVALPDPAGATVVRVTSAEDLRRAVLDAATGRPAGDAGPSRLSGDRLAGGMAPNDQDLAPDGAGPVPADAVVMAAAVADFRPARRAATKIKRGEAIPEALPLERTPDVLAELVSLRPAGQVIVGFAAETDNVRDNGLAKLAKKGCDLLVVNQVGEGLAFGTPDNEALVLGPNGMAVEVPRGPKDHLADIVWDQVGARLE